MILPESYFDVIGCTISCKGGVRTISHDGKVIIRAELRNKLYRAKIDFRVGKNKPKAFIKGDSMVRCQNYFCELQHHHPLHTLEGAPGKLWKLKEGDAALHLSFAAGNETTFASQLLLAHKMFAHLNFKYVRKALGLSETGANPVCNTCSMVKLKQSKLPRVTMKRSTRPLHRLCLDIFFSADALKPWQIVVDDFSRYSWVQQIGSKDQALVFFKRLVEFLEKDKHPWTVAIVRTDAEPVYNSHAWVDYCSSPGSVKQHEVSAPYKHGQNGVPERSIGILGLNAKAMMVEGGAPNTDFQYAIYFSCFCKNNAPTKSNRQWLSPMAMFECNDELKVSSRVFKAVLFCLVHVYLYKEERRKHEQRSYAAMFLGVDPSHGSFLVKCLQSGRLYHASDMAVHPHTFPYRGQSLPQPLRHHHERLEGACRPGVNSFETEVQPGTIPTGEFNAEMLVPENKVNSPEVTSFEVTSPEVTSPEVTSDAPRTQRQREPSAKALEAIATYNIAQTENEDEPDPQTYEEAMNSYDADLWAKGMEKELENFRKHKTLKVVKAETWMKIFKAKLVFKRKRNGERKVRCVVQAFKKMFKQGVDFEQSYAGTTRWSSVILVTILAVFHDLSLYLIDIAAFFLHGRLAENEKIYMEELPGQGLPSGYINQVVRSLYGHPVSAFRAKTKLHANLTRDGLFVQSKYDSCLYILKHETEKFWLPVHVDDMTCTGTPGGLAITLARLREVFEITVEENPKVILGVQIERDRAKRTAKLHQGDYIRKILKKYGMENCNVRDTPTEANFTSQVQREIQRNPERRPLGMEDEYQSLLGSIMYTMHTRKDLGFLIGLGARFMHCAGPVQMGWLKRGLRYLAHFPEKGLMIIPGKKLYLHGASDADWGGENTSMKSTTGAYLALGDFGVVWSCSKLQRKVADSSTAAETYALHETVKSVIEVHGKLAEMGVQVELPIKLMQDNAAVIRMSEVMMAHGGTKHIRIPQSFIHEEVLSGLIKCCKVSSEEQGADSYTKATSRIKFKKDMPKSMGPQPGWE